MSELSVPLSVPTEIGSVLIHSSVFDFQDERIEDGNFLYKWSVPMWMVSGAALLLFTSSRSQMWKKDALQMRVELQRQKAVLPFALSLLNEREILTKVQKLLEEDLGRLKGSGSGRSKNEVILSPNESGNSAILSMKNS